MSSFKGNTARGNEARVRQPTLHGRMFHDIVARVALLLALLGSTCLLALPSSSRAAAFSDMYIFGDSLSDNGNLYTWTDRTGNPVTGGTPIPLSPPYSPGRFQNGPSYSELLWSNLGLTGNLTPSYQGGTNFAVGGARSRYHAFDLNPAGLPGSPPYLFATFSLLGQYQSYLTSLAGSPADSDALYVVWGGANDLQDVLAIAGTRGLAAAQARLVEAVGDITSVVAALITLGVRDLLVPTVPDIGRVPGIVAQGPQTQAAGTFFTNAFNHALDAALASLPVVPELQVTRFDVFGLLNGAIANPGAYGFTNVTNACLVGLYVAPRPGDPATPTVCASPDQYLFWDIVHPSAHTHEILADAMARAVPEPMPLALVGMAALCWFASARAVRIRVG